MKRTGVFEVTLYVGVECEVPDEAERKPFGIEDFFCDEYDGKPEFREKFLRNAMAELSDGEPEIDWHHYE